MPELQVEVVATTAELLARVLAGEQALTLLDTGDAAALADEFRRQALLGGQSLYLWNAEEGLCSLREAGVRVPATHRPGDALRYVLQSMHFGIYLIPLPLQDLPAVLPLLHQILRQRAGYARRVVLLAPLDALPPALAEQALRLRLAASGQGRLRLRGGRWVR